MAHRMLRISFALLALGTLVASPALTSAKPPGLPGVDHERGTPQVSPEEELNNQATPLFPALTTWMHAKKPTNTCPTDCCAEGCPVRVGCFVQRVFTECLNGVNCQPCPECPPCAKTTDHAGCDVQRRWLLKAFRNAVKHRRFEKANELAAQILALEPTPNEEVETQPILFLGSEVKECQCQEGKACCEDCKCEKGKACPKCKCKEETPKCKCSEGKPCCEDCKCKEGKAACPKCKCEQKAPKCCPQPTDSKSCPCPPVLQELIEDIDGSINFIGKTGPNNQPIRSESYYEEQFIPWHDSYDIDTSASTAPRFRTHCAEIDVTPKQMRFSWKFSLSGESYEVKYNRAGWRVSSGTSY